MIPHIHWCVSGFVSLFIGLAAFNFNILKVCKLEKQRSLLQMIAGAFGALNLYRWFKYAHSCSCNLNNAVWFITGFATLCVGLAGIGFNVIKVTKCEKARVILQYIVGAAGTYSLLHYFKFA